MMTHDLDHAAPRGTIRDGLGAPSLKQRAYDELKLQILTGRLAPGALLSERQLAGSLKMSKTPVHAALERLEADGLVTVAAQQGVVVREMSPRDVADHYEIREALETFVVAKLAGRLTGEQWQRLERNLEDNDQAVRNSDLDANARLDAEFHLLLCESLGNREVSRVMVQIREKIHGVIHHISERFPQRMAISLAEHRAIAHSIRSGDGTGAAELTATHLHNGLRNLYDRRA